MSTLEFRTAIRDAIAEELERDESVVFFGEDVAAAGGVFVATPGLQERFGAERVFDTPISEMALAGAAFGAAVAGMRPIFEVMFGDFMALPMDSLVNQAAKFWYVSCEQGSVPLVVRVGSGTLRTATPGAKRSTQVPKSENVARASARSVAATVTTSGTRAGDTSHASTSAFPAAAT